MKILAFDTSSAACSVALQFDQDINVIHEIAPMQQARLILSHVNTLLTAADLKVSELDAIAYGCGPGSFTGIRIANSVAQGLGFAAQCPLIPISSLNAIAEAAHLEHRIKQVLVTLDARTEQVYWAAYQADQDGSMHALTMETLSFPQEVALPTSFSSESWQGAGDGWLKYEQQWCSQGMKPAGLYSAQLPTAEAILRLAGVKLRKGNGDCIAARDAIPVYLR